ncbi:MAG: HAD hydrolase-like protein, partial [Bacteroidota bacterium]
MQLRKIEAVIFDMDGLLADTEPLWRNAMVDQFNKSGISFDEEDCRVTTGMRFREVVEYWNGIRPFSAASVSDVHDSVLNTLCKLILENNIEL